MLIAVTVNCGLPLEYLARIVTIFQAFENRRIFQTKETGSKLKQQRCSYAIADCKAHVEFFSGMQNSATVSLPLPRLTV
jgi:hypothetical protein